jgi:hypothetical protein
MLAANGTVYDRSARFNRNSTRGSRSNCTIDYCETRSVLVNVFYSLSNELVILKWKTNMHHVTMGDGCGLIDIYAKRSISALDNLHQRLADFT